MQLNRNDVERIIARVYTRKMGGKVWCSYDASKRAYGIRGDGLPAHPDLADKYPNGWSMSDYLKPIKAWQVIVEETL